MTGKKSDPFRNAGAAMKRAAAGASFMKNTDQLYAERVRQLFTKNDDVRDSGLTEPEDVECVTDIAYGPDPMQVLDLYYPAGADKALPTIVSVHGGGFVYGDKERYRFYCMSLARRGFAVVNFSYRLAPEFRFPAQLTDTNLVMQLICSRAGKDAAEGTGNAAAEAAAREGATGEVFSAESTAAGSSVFRILDPGSLFMVGDSAGAQLVTQYCAALNNPAYAQLLGLDPPPLPVRACALNCGLYHFDLKKDRMMARCYFDGAARSYADKMDLFGNITKDFPPAFIMTSTGDFLRARAEPLAARLAELGVENELHVYGDEVTKPGHVFHCNMKDPLAARCNDEECEFFRRHMK